MNGANEGRSDAPMPVNERRDLIRNGNYLVVAEVRNEAV
jgi:hypothetical protein